MALMPRVPLNVELDFLQPRGRTSWLGWTLLAAGLVAGAHQVAEFRTARAELDEREAIVARLREELRRSAGTASNVPREPVAADEAKAALDIAARLNADWGRMFAAVVAAQSDDTTWVALQADTARGGLNITGEARSLAEVFEFLARLGVAEGIRDARLSNYEWTRVGALDVVRFTVSAKWSAGR